jgi:hypothetical protein
MKRERQEVPTFLECRPPGTDFIICLPLAAFPCGPFRLISFAAFVTLATFFRRRPGQSSFSYQASKFPWNNEPVISGTALSDGAHASSARIISKAMRVAKTKGERRANLSSMPSAVS